MTIDEVIEREQYSAEANREMADTYHTDENIYLKEEEAFRNREDYHRQLAEWLRELKKYEEGIVQIKELINDYKGHDMWDTANGMQLALECLEGSDSE